MNMFNVTVVIHFSAVEDSGVPYFAIVQLTTVQRFEIRYKLLPNYRGKLKRGTIDEKAFKLGCASETLYVSGLTKLFLMDILREFLESSTIHGLSYISTSKVRGW